MDFSRAIFIDTSGFYASLDSRDTLHHQARELLKFNEKKTQLFLTSDYVLDETATLLKARALGHLTASFFGSVNSSTALRVMYLDKTLFWRTTAFFWQHRDHAYSFTDCSSFVIMKELGLTKAMTSDHHFTEAGFEKLL